MWDGECGCLLDWLLWRGIGPFRMDIGLLLLGFSSVLGLLLYCPSIFIAFLLFILIISI